MSSSSSSSSSSPSSSSSSASRPRSSWLQVVLFTLLVYILIFSTACCQAAPAKRRAKMDVLSKLRHANSFSIFISGLRQQAHEYAEYKKELNRLRDLGVLDSDYNVISVPPETAKLMEKLG
eukprot:XP_011673172.1 PREDICTED: uncharacterized protein LOC105442603 [Strongylocentrotus purpuratus]